MFEEKRQMVIFVGKQSEFNLVFNLCSTEKSEIRKRKLGIWEFSVAKKVIFFFPPMSFPTEYVCLTTRKSYHFMPTFSYLFLVQTFDTQCVVYTCSSILFSTRSLHYGHITQKDGLPLSVYFPFLDFFRDRLTVCPPQWRLNNHSAVMKFYLFESWRCTKLSADSVVPLEPSADGNEKVRP